MDSPMQGAVRTWEFLHPNEFPEILIRSPRAHIDYSGCFLRLDVSNFMSRWATVCRCARVVSRVSGPCRLLHNRCGNWLWRVFYVQGLLAAVQPESNFFEIAIRIKSCQLPGAWNARFSSRSYVHSMPQLRELTYRSFIIPASQSRWYKVKTKTQFKTLTGDWEGMEKGYRKNEQDHITCCHMYDLMRWTISFVVF